MSNKKERLNARRLRELFVYDSLTGLFSRRIRRASQPEGPVRLCLNAGGYQQMMIDGVMYYGHRLAWLYVYNEWPRSQLDHKDGVRHHNWIDNLRLASAIQNGANAHRRRDNESKCKGVHLHRQSGKWRAQIKCGSKRRSLGLFDTVQEAAESYAAAARSAFGEFARTDF